MCIPHSAGPLRCFLDRDDGGYATSGGCRCRRGAYNGNVSSSTPRRGGATLGYTVCPAPLLCAARG